MPKIPEYGSFEYRTWCHDMTEDRLRWFVNVTDAFQMSMLRSLLSASVMGIDLRRLTDHDLLRELALALRSGRLVVHEPPNAFGNILSGICSARDVSIRQQHKRIALQSSAAALTAKLAQDTRAPAAATVMTNIVPKRDIALTVNDQFRARLGTHTPLTDGARYKLTTDQGEVREGTVTGGKINEAQVTMNKTVWIEMLTSA
jgi:hypothetical protein